VDGNVTLGKLNYEKSSMLQVTYMGGSSSCWRVI